MTFLYFLTKFYRFNTELFTLELQNWPFMQYFTFFFDFYKIIK